MRFERASDENYASILPEALMAVVVCSNRRQSYGIQITRIILIIIDGR